MNLIFYIILAFFVLSVLNFMWPIVVVIAILWFLNYLMRRVQLRKAEYQQEKQEKFYETIETPKAGLDVIDVEYEEKERHE